MAHDEGKSTEPYASDMIFLHAMPWAALSRDIDFGDLRLVRLTRARLHEFDKLPDAKAIRATLKCFRDARNCRATDIIYAQSELGPFRVPTLVERNLFSVASRALLLGEVYSQMKKEISRPPDAEFSFTVCSERYEVHDLVAYQSQVTCAAKRSGGAYSLATGSSSLRIYRPMAAGAAIVEPDRDFVWGIGQYLKKHMGTVKYTKVKRCLEWLFAAFSASESLDDDVCLVMIASAIEALLRDNGQQGKYDFGVECERVCGWKVNQRNNLELTLKENGVAVKRRQAVSDQFVWLVELFNQRNSIVHNEPDFKPERFYQVKERSMHHALLGAWVVIELLMNLMAESAVFGDTELENYCALWQLRKFQTQLGWETAQHLGEDSF